MDAGLFDEREDGRWQQQIIDTRKNFEKKVMAGYALRGALQKRKSLYASWRKELGDNQAREVAKFVEALISEEIRWPKWFASRSSY